MGAFDFRHYNNGIVAFDAGYVRPILAAIHLVVEQGRVALIDTGSNDSLHNTLEALSQLGLNADSVDYIILTHIHLDHAGGAGTMMQAFKNARLVVHPRGARHMAQPAKLVEGVTAVYGPEYVQRVYGDILPIDPDRIIEATDGWVVSLAGRRLLCIDTPGHAKHHICIVDEKTSSIFTGDMFGLSYREMDVDGRAFIFPTTTPTQFDPQAMRQSIERLLGFNPQAMYLTHYSEVKNPQALGQTLLIHLDAVVDMALRENNDKPTRHQRIKDSMSAYLLKALRAHGCELPKAQILDIWAMDLELNAQGLCVWLDTLP